MRAASAAVALAAAALLAGCGGSVAPATSPRTTALTPLEKRGRALFLRTCGACHELADAGAHGTAGPSLDAHPWREVYVREVIASGPGLMPDGLLEDGDADAVAAYVAAATHR